MTKRLKLLVCRAVFRGPMQEVGETIEVPGDEALRMVAAGQAVYANETPVSAMHAETAMEEKVMPPRRGRPPKYVETRNA